MERSSWQSPSLARRLGVVRRQLAGRQTPGQLVGLVLGDSPEAWRQAGFAVEGSTVHLGDIQIRLRGGSSGQLLGVVVDPRPTNPGYSYIPPEFLPGVPFLGRSALESIGEPVTPVQSNANGAVALGELIVHVGDSAGGVDAAVERLVELGIAPHKGRPARALGPLTIARYFLGECRLLLVGPSSAINATLPPAMSWMAPSKGKAAKPTVTGWLVRVKSIEVVQAALGDKVGEVKKAEQPGRVICTMPRGIIDGMDSTLAFITDEGPTPLF